MGHARLALFIIAVFSWLTLGGCGGGAGGGQGSGGAPGASRGQVTIKLHWPARGAGQAAAAPGTGRQIPVAANSVRLRLLLASGEVLADRLFVRPDVERAELTETFNNLPQAIVTIEANAFPNADGTGNPLAQVETAVTVFAGRATQLNLALDSAVVRVTTQPENIALTGLPVLVTAAAFDARGNQVLTDRWEWRNSNPAVIRLEPNGTTATLTAVGVGTATVTLTETESGVSTQRQFTVAPLP